MPFPTYFLGWFAGWLMSSLRHMPTLSAQSTCFQEQPLIVVVGIVCRFACLLLVAVAACEIDGAGACVVLVGGLF